MPSEQKKDAIPDFSALNREFAADRNAAYKQAEQTPQVPGANFDAEKGGPYAAPSPLESARLNAINKFTFGLAPAMDDILHKGAVWLHGEDKVPPSMRQQLEAGDQINPVASTIGGGVGMMGNVGNALKLTEGLRSISLPLLGQGAVQRAAAFGGLDAADQAVRTQTEDRPFSSAEVGGSALLGAIDPSTILSKGAGVLGNLPGVRNVMGPIYDMAKRVVPSAFPKPQMMPGPPMPPVAGAPPKPPPVGGRYTGGPGFQKTFQPIPGVAPPGSGPVQGPPAPAQVFGPPRPVPVPQRAPGGLLDTGEDFIRTLINSGSKVGSNEREEERRRRGRKAAQ